MFSIAYLILFSLVLYFNVHVWDLATLVMRCSSFHSVCSLFHDCIYESVLAMIPFYMSTWEEYHTGILYLGYLNGPTEGLIVSSLTMILSGVFGPQIWRTELQSLLGPVLPGPLGYFHQNATIFDLIVAICIISAVVFQVPFGIKAVFDAGRRRKHSRFRIQMLQLIPMLIFQMAVVAWAMSPRSIILKGEHFFLYAMTIGIVFGRIAVGFPCSFKHG